MALIATCQCGAQFSVKPQFAGKKVRCKRCGGPVRVPHPTQAAPTVAERPRPSEESNPLAMVGFVFAMLGFCFVTLTAPIALGCSIAGLRKRTNHGLAVAGTIISSLQLIIMLLMFYQFFVMGRWAWVLGQEAKEAVVQRAVQGIEKFDRFAGIEMTKVHMDTAARKIDENTVAAGRLPADAEGNRLIQHQKDGFDNQLMYEINGTELATYSILSAGPDEEWDTKDDIGRTNPTLAPKHPAEALVLLNNDKTHRQEAGLDWLSSAEPVEDQREKVFAALLAVSRNPQLKSKAYDALIKWGSEDDLKRLVSNPRIDEIVAIDILAKMMDEEGVVALVNHPNEAAREKANLLLVVWGTSEDIIVRQCLKDLGQRDRQGIVVQRLAAIQISEALQSDVKNAVFQLLLTRSGRTAGAPAIELLDRIGLTAAEVRKLITVYEQTGNGRALDVLIKHQDKQMLEWFARKIGDPGVISSHASKFLTSVGPAAESYVWAGMKSQRTNYQIPACKLLAAIGTKQSIEHLQPLTADPFVGRHAKSAIEKIEAADRKPNDVTTPESTKKKPLQLERMD